MSVLVYTESEEKKYKKIAFEAVSYGYEVAKMQNSSVTAVSINAENASILGSYGASKVIEITHEQLGSFNAKAYAQAIAQVAKKENAKTIILSSTANAKYIAPLLAVYLDASLAANVVSLPESNSPFVVKTNVFTNKAFSKTELKNEIKIIGLSKNAFGVRENNTTAVVESFTPELSEAHFSVKTQSVDKAAGKVTIADAEIVVSGGRGLKGPENWNLIEDLAEVLGAATACSKPVSDMGWRPHSEHVGQTGKPVASNLYIAVGVSGAIQHLAGINASKVKVVINNDAEAPFFKAADYGIVGDAFEVVPKLIEKLKDFKANNA